MWTLYECNERDNIQEIKRKERNQGKREKRLVVTLRLWSDDEAIKMLKIIFKYHPGSVCSENLDLNLVYVQKLVSHLVVLLG